MVTIYKEGGKSEVHCCHPTCSFFPFENVSHPVEDKNDVHCSNKEQVSGYLQNSFGAQSVQDIHNVLNVHDKQKKPY